MKSEFDRLIEPHSLQREYFKDLWRYGELFYFFAWRDILVRYKQALLGVAWVIVRPLISMGAFMLIFGQVAKMPSSPVNYSLFVMAGLLPWQLFSSSLNDSSLCLVNNTSLISKIYFPRLIIPSSLVLVNMFDFFISFTLLFAVMIGCGYGGWAALFLAFPFVGIATLLSLGVGFWLSALSACYRDFRFLTPFVLQFGIFVSPVGYSTEAISERWQWLYMLNPLVGIIDGFRWAFFGITYPGLGLACSLSLGVSLFLLVSGFLYFRKIERSFADII